MRDDSAEDKIIAETMIEDILISTEVRNGDYNSVLINLRDPKIWFKKPYKSEKEAIEGHEAWVNYIKKNINKIMNTTTEADDFSDLIINMMDGLNGRAITACRFCGDLRYFGVKKMLIAYTKSDNLIVDKDFNRWFSTCKHPL